jgi:hypothetical protein
MRCKTQMDKKGNTLRRRHVADYAATAIEQMDIYCTVHRDSPSAMRRPKLFIRNDLWIALLGPSIEEGILGIGPSVAAALRAFDAQYVAEVPNETISASINPEQSFTVQLRRLPEC